MDDSTEKAASPAAALPEQPPSFLSLTEFLESSAPDSFQAVSDLLVFPDSRSSVGYLNTTAIGLHCSNEVCDGIRQFGPTSKNSIEDGWNYEFVRYVCKNCGKTLKMFALAVIRDGRNKQGRVCKLGELPSFGPPTPSRVVGLVGKDRELFLKGRRAELHGLGIGAFSYYRRVVEEQKGRIIGEIGKVAARLEAHREILELFSKAQGETQFSKAIEMIKSAIQESLQINGHNPLTLLHGPLSEGLHAHTDEECLGLATSIRVVLTELAERISNALKDEAELKGAVHKLLARKSPHA
jgi:hypothetical protein